MVKKVCKKDKLIYEGSVCPLCKSDQVGQSWKGRIYMVDANKSEIAKKIGITTKGEYAIKVK